MNYFYIEYMIQEKIREEHERCERQRLLRRGEDRDLPTRILASARTAFLYRGFENTRIKDICRSLGISKRSFYKHFDSLDEVLEVLWAR